MTIITVIKKAFRQCDDRSPLFRSKKSRIGLTILTIMIKIAVILTTGRRKTKKLEKINRQRSVENLPSRPENIRFGNDNLIVFVKLIIRFYRFHRSFAAEPRDYIIGKNDIYFGTFLPITILIKILILISQIFI
jgi:hypothetical protein